MDSASEEDEGETQRQESAWSHPARMDNNRLDGTGGVLLTIPDVGPSREASPNSASSGQTEMAKWRMGGDSNPRFLLEATQF